ncbi:hypothetical protein PIB30_055516 [Stylosanthes scabra]|uniref:Uncharacterized protein n=1 Tax=Stylosanthes scabra TaxID=79078 RepID=A0ABU6YHV7_9FABA|nr:hypothetical protein [Stylosanthes scabra]
MTCKGNEVASIATPSRARRTANSNRGWEPDFLNERYETFPHYETSKTLAGRGKEGITWANDPADASILKRLDNVILNAKVTAWHKLIVANIDPKTHATTFLMEHAILIYILMTQGSVNLPRITQDIMVKWPSAKTRNLLLYLMFITRLANQHQVLEFAGDEFMKIRQVDMYYPYRDWKGEQPKVLTRAIYEGYHEILASSGAFPTQHASNDLLSISGQGIL